jgi:hypothetical protein
VSEHAQAQQRCHAVAPERASADAAALRDLLRTLKARFPLVEVLLASTLVQGSEAPAQIDALADLLKAHRPVVIETEAIAFLLLS